jgi:hypothetical protein
VVPDVDVALGELAHGEVAIDLFAPTEMDPGYIDQQGGTVTGPAGLQFEVPANAASGPAGVTLRPGVVPANAATHPDFLGALDLELTGAALDPIAPYRLFLGTPVADGQEFVLAQVQLLAGRVLLEAVAFGVSDAGWVRVDACRLFGTTSICLPGLLGTGAYALFALPGGTSIVEGDVVDPAGAAAGGLVVESDAAPYAAVTDASGHYRLPVASLQSPATITVTARDPARDLLGTVPIPASSLQPPASIVTADIQLLGTGPTVTGIDPPNHGSQVALDAAIVVTFSEPLAPASIGTEGIQLLRVDSPVSSLPTPVLFSLSPDATQLTLRPQQPLAANTVYRLMLTADLTDRASHPLAPDPRTTNHEPPTVFTSDFTTSAIFKAQALPPDTLQISLPEDDTGARVEMGVLGRVFICGGAQLAYPGTVVSIENQASGATATMIATDASGVSGSEWCDALFAGRCNTTQPGSFCAVLDAAIGDPMVVQVEDAFGNVVALDAGPMRDERTGATAIGPAGGTAEFPADPRCHAVVPVGAFDEPTIVQITPIVRDPTPELGALDLADYPELEAQPALPLIGAVKLDFAGIAKQHLDVWVPYPDPPADAATRQYLTTQRISFRRDAIGQPRFELTLVDTASLDTARCAVPADCLLHSDPSPLSGIIQAGMTALHSIDGCAVFVTGWAQIEDFTVFTLPVTYDLAAGEHPPRTV